MKFPTLRSVKTPNTDPAIIQAEIAKENHELTETRAAIAVLEDELDRHVIDREYVIADAKAPQLHRLRQIERGAIERLPGLHEALREALRVTRETAISKYKSELREVFARVRDALAILGEANGAAIAFNEARRAEFGDGDAAKYFPRVYYNGVAYPENVAPWIANMNAVIASIPSHEPQKSVAPCIVAVAPAITKPAVPTVINAVEPPAPRPKRALPPPVVGGTAIKMLRSNVDLEDGSTYQSQAGDLLILEDGLAKQLVSGGVADFAELMESVRG